MEKQLYFNKLDSLRFIAFFLVIWHHAFSDSFQNISENYIVSEIIQKITITGVIGVHIFFVISGFLITYLMLQEEISKGRLNIGYFYLRRFFRILPLYYLIMILGVFVLPKLFNTLSFEGDIIKNLLFLNNFDMGNANSNVDIAWSVAIEEQFYLFWPLIFLLFKNKNVLFSFSITLFILSTLFVLNNPSEAYFHTFGNIRFLMIGCSGAILYSKNTQKAQKLSILKPHMIYYAIVMILFLHIYSSFSQAIYFLTLIALPLLYLFLVVNLVIQGNDKKKRVLSKLGKYTYGMYLYHPLIIIFVKIILDLLSINYTGNSYINFFQALLSLIITIIVSYFSYEYFEKKILKYKNKFSFIKTRI